MGFGSTKTEWYYSSSVTEVLGKEPNRLANALMQSQINGVRVSKRLVENVVNGKGLIFNQLHKYATTSVLGLPQGTTAAIGNMGTAEVQTYLRNALNQPELVTTKVELDYDNEEHHTRYKLYAEHGWEPIKNNFTRPSTDTLAEITAAATTTFTELSVELGTELTIALEALPTEQELPVTTVTVDGVLHHYKRSRTFTYAEPVLDPVVQEDTLHRIQATDFVPIPLEDGKSLALSGFRIARLANHTVRAILKAYVDVTTVEYQQEVDADGNALSGPIETGRVTITRPYTFSQYQTLNTALTDLTVDVSTFNRADLYIYAESRWNETDAVTGAVTRKEHVWLYNLKDNTVPNALDYAQASLINPFYPAIPVRIDNQDPIDAGLYTDEQQKDIDQIMRWCGFSLDLVRDGIKENPDVEEIDQAVLAFGVELTNDNPAAIRYMADFFSYMRGVHNEELTITPPVELMSKEEYLALDHWGRSSEISDEEMYSNYVAHYNAAVAQGYLDDLGALTEKGKQAMASLQLELPQKLFFLEWKIPGLFPEDYPFENRLSWAGITEQYHIGSIGPKGAVTREYTKDYVRFNVQEYVDMYRSVTVYGLTYTSVIRRWGTGENQQAVTGVNHYYAFEPDQNPSNDGWAGLLMPDDGFSGISSGVFIPLYHPVVEDMALSEKTALYYSSIYLLTSSVKSVKVKWYEQGFFQNIIKMAAFVLAVLGYVQMSYRLMALAVTAGMAAALYQLALYIVYSFLIEIAINLVIDWIGVENAMILALIAAAYFGKELAADNFMLIEGSLADKLLKGTNALAQGVAKNVQDSLQSLSTEIMDFNTLVQDGTEALAVAQAELETNLLLSPISFITATDSTSPTAVETPDEFYYRTVHAGNVGPVSYDIVERYVELSLTLPKSSF